MTIDKDFDENFQKALKAAGSEYKGGHPNNEFEYAQALYKHVSDDHTRKVYVESVIERLLKKAKKDVVDYDVAERALRRAAREVARDWKLRTVMSVGISKAGQERMINEVASSFMHIYQIRLGQQKQAERERREHFSAAGGTSAGRRRSGP